MISLCTTLAPATEEALRGIVTSYEEGYGCAHSRSASARGMRRAIYSTSYSAVRRARAGARPRRRVGVR